MTSSKRKDLEAWEPWQVSTLKLQWMDGRTGTEIATVVRKTRGAVMGKIKRLGLPKRGRTRNERFSNVSGGRIRVANAPVDSLPNQTNPVDGTFSKNLVTTPPPSSEEKSAPQITGMDRKIG